MAHSSRKDEDLEANDATTVSAADATDKTTTSAATNRLLLRDWIGYYLTEFKFVSDYAERDEKTASVLQTWLSRYGLRSTLKKTQDAYRAAHGFFFRRGNKTLATESPIGEPSPKRTKTAHQTTSSDDRNVLVTPERPNKKSSAQLEQEKKTEAEARAKAKAKALAEAKAKAEAEARAKLLAEFDFVDFQPVGKKRLEMGKLSKKLGGALCDRQDSIEQLYCALEKLAGKLNASSPSQDETASRDTDETEYHDTEETETAEIETTVAAPPQKVDNKPKQTAPLIGITGRPGTGKTDFLKWIFNNCCTLQGQTRSFHSEALLQRLNRALPESEAPFENLLVLYASYSGTSAYSTNEGPICGTTVERLLRSFHGITEFQDNYPAQKRVRYEGFWKGQNIVDVFRKTYGKTGFVFLLDDLSHLQQESESEYKELLDSILEFSQFCLDSGTLCAVVGSAESPFDLCDTVINHCGKVLEPINFPAELPELEAKTRKLLLDESNETDREIHHDRHGLSFSVTMKVLQSMYSARAWEEYLLDSDARHRVEPLVPKQFRLPPTVSAEYVFLLASRTLLGAETVELLDPQTAQAVVDHLNGHLVLETEPLTGQITEWGDGSWPRGKLSLPSWRLFQFGTSFRKQVFPQVQNWVWVETRKLFYEYGPTDATKTLETTTMALLELRRAMLQAVLGKPPSLQALFDGIRVHHNISETILETTRATKGRASLQCFGALPYSFEVVTEPTLFLSGCASNEKGIEGVLRECFENKAIFFQTKAYAAGGEDELRGWLVQAHKRARDLGYANGEYMLWLFVPGDGGDEEDDSTADSDYASDTSRWPANSMVLSDNALVDIFDPFIKLTLY